MKKFSKHTPEQIVRKLEKIAAIRSEGQSIADACRQVGVSPATFHRWERSYGSMSRQEAKTFGKLQEENRQLKRLVAEAELEKAALRELAESNF